MTVGTFIKERRKQLGYSQAVLARKLKLSTTQFISNIERGVADVPAGRVVQLSKALKISPNKLIDFHLTGYGKTYTARVYGRTK